MSAGVAELAVREISASLEDKSKKTIKAQRRFLVKSDTPLREFQIEQIVGAIGSVHPDYPGLFCVAYQAKQTRKDRTLWDVTLNYENRDLSDYQENPLQRPAQVSWTTVSYEEDFVRDINGKAVVNSAGDYFNPPIKVQRSRWQAQYTRNVANVPGWLVQYSDAINSDNFTLGPISVAPRCAKIDRIEISPLQVENGVQFYTLRIGLTVQPESWQPKIADRGLYVKVDGKRQRARVNGEPATEPVFLDGKGGMLSDPTPDNIVWLTQYKAYRELPFNVLFR